MSNVCFRTGETHTLYNSLVQSWRVLWDPVLLAAWDGSDCPHGGVLPMPGHHSGLFLHDRYLHSGRVLNRRQKPHLQRARQYQQGTISANNIVVRISITWRRTFGQTSNNPERNVAISKNSQFWHFLIFASAAIVLLYGKVGILVLFKPLTKTWQIDTCLTKFFSWDTFWAPWLLEKWKEEKKNFLK